MKMYLYKQYQDKSGDMYYITILCYSFILITLGLNLFQAITVWEFGDTVTKNQVLFNSSIKFLYMSLVFYLYFHMTIMKPRRHFILLLSSLLIIHLLFV
jgi:hypothetical protein